MYRIYIHVRVAKVQSEVEDAIEMTEKCFMKLNFYYHFSRTVRKYITLSAVQCSCKL